VQWKQGYLHLPILKDGQLWQLAKKIMAHIIFTVKLVVHFLQA
jgi:hypothetical protein